MKRQLTILWAMLLCVCGLTLVACGGNADKPAADDGKDAAVEESAKKEEAEPAVDPAEKFFGTWKLAFMEREGVTLVADFASFADMEDGMQLTINEDGTAKMNFDGEDQAFKWELQEDESLKLMEAKEDESSDEDVTVEDADGDDEVDEVLDEAIEDGDAFTATFVDGAVVLKTISTDDVELQESPITITFTADGKSADYPVLAASLGAPITSAEGLAGTYQLAGMNYGGVTMYGTSEALMSMNDTDVDMTLTLNENGSASFMGNDGLNWSVDENGAKLTVPGNEVPLYGWGDKLILDMTVASQDGSAILVCFSK